MNVFSRIAGLFPRGKPAAGENGDPAATIIDVESLTPSAGNGRQPSAQEKISVLKRLALFVEKERLPLIAILCWPPLHAVADGESFRGVTVRYVGENGDIAKFITRLLEQTGGREKAVVVTADRKIERVIQALGSPIMHPATFRKALEPTEASRPRQNGRNAPASAPVDENRRIVNELIDPL